MRYNLKGTICADEDAPVYKYFGLAAVSPADIRQALADNPDGEEFVLEINSGGGSVYAGFEMYSILRGAKTPTRAEVQSLAGSAASVVLAAVDTAAASPVGQVMIHLPSTYTEGNQIVHRESVQMLEAVTGSIIAAYEAKCRGKTSRDALRRMMDRETFLTAQEAMDAGLIDEIIGADEGAAASPLDVFNAAGGAPDIEQMRAAYRAANPPGGNPPPAPTLDDGEAQARARAIALAEAEMDMITL